MFKKGNVPWNKGKVGLTIPWNKGKSHSEETKLKISRANRGYRHTKEAKIKMSKNRKTRVVSEETRTKISLANKGRIRTASAKKRISKGTKQAMLLLPLLNKERIKKTQFTKGQFAGRNHNNWKGGVSFKPYCHKFNDELKEKIRERDNKTCKLCGAKENGRKLSVHHVHYDKTNCKPQLISLCVRCNSKVNFNKDYYENLFVQLLEGSDKP